ncbi:MAG: carbohydrate-binding domain-containing protein [Lachnospiraceae bacterium]|nr:carbohydrate-binding domain-containing protein [Lachnospiraceae bacterium]
MLQKAKFTFVVLLTAVLLYGCGEAPAEQVNTANVMEGNSTEETAVVIELQGDTAVLDGQAIEEFEYTWHSDPAKTEEWYEGTEPNTENKAYIAHDIWYYPELNEDGFSKVEYDGENEWAYHYTAEGYTDFIYATLPIQGETVPTEMMHSAKEAYDNPVLHITKPGTYILQGNWNGQIMIDLGEKEETFQDDNAKVKLILNGVDVNCTVAPAFVAYSAFECDNGWEEREEYSNAVNTEEAGIAIEIADNSVNNFSGTNIYRMLKPEYKKEGSTVQKKLRKIDGAFYSFVSMNLNGQEKETGILNITSGFEGLDDELHLTIHSGNINIYAQNDGINVNEDGVSVFTMNGGTVHIFAGLGAEGDGIDSNGFIVVNGGMIAGGTPSGSDELLDSDCGNTVNGGEVITIGSSRGFGMGEGEFGKEPPMGFDKEPPEGFEQGRRSFGDENFRSRDLPEEFKKEVPGGDAPKESN